MLASSKTQMRLAGLGLTLVLSTSCGQQPLASTTKVTNGIAISVAKLPQVAFLVINRNQAQFICTGTFVDDHQVITAGHCVEGLGKSGSRMDVVDQQLVNGAMQQQARAQALSYARNPRYNVTENNGVNRHDLSIVNFPAGTSDQFAPIATKAPLENDTIMIAGYGNNRTYLDDNGNQIGNGSGVFRAGRNVLTSVSEGMLIFVGVPARTSGISPGDSVASGAGDSGGPLFNANGQLAGVTSGGGLEKAAGGAVASVSMYVDLNSAESRSFLAAHLD